MLPRKPHPIEGETERFNSVGPGNSFHRNVDDALLTLESCGIVSVKQWDGLAV